MSTSKVDTLYYTSPAQRSEEGVSTSLFMSPDSNYKFADVAKMNATIAKETERLRLAQCQKYNSRSDMPPPQSIPISVQALKDRKREEQRQI